MSINVGLAYKNFLLWQTFCFQEMANSKLKLRKIKHLEPSASCNILWSCHLRTRCLTLLTLCGEQTTYLKGYFWSWKPVSNHQLMSLLPLKEQALGLGIRETGLVVPQQILRDKLAVVPWVQGGVEQERIVLWAESGTRKDTIKHTLEEAGERTLHHAFSLSLSFAQRCSAFLTDMTSVILKNYFSWRATVSRTQMAGKGKGMLLGTLHWWTRLSH